MPSKAHEDLTRRIRLNAAISELVHGVRPVYYPPEFDRVFNYCLTLFLGAEKFAADFYRTMLKQNWRDQEGKPLRNWQRLCRVYVSRAAVRRR